MFCDAEESFSNICTSESGIEINISSFIETGYEKCVTSNVSRLLKKAYLHVINENHYDPPQNRKTRSNVIILTDLSVVDTFYDRMSINLQEILFFIFSNAKENHQDNKYPAHLTEQYFYTSDNVSKKAIGELIVNQTLSMLIFMQSLWCACSYFINQNTNRHTL
uniref:Uncharacterized protein n=1 Tax=Panagrolaimus davidi TaxID=227884 RepID=A0A914PKR2_9BILA